MPSSSQRAEECFLQEVTSLKDEPNVVRSRKRWKVFQAKRPAGAKVQGLERVYEA